MGYAGFCPKGTAGTNNGRSHSVRAPADGAAGVSVRAFQHGITSLQFTKKKKTGKPDAASRSGIIKRTQTGSRSGQAVQLSITTHAHAAHVHLTHHHAGRSPCHETRDPFKVLRWSEYKRLPRLCQFSNLPKKTADRSGNFCVFAEAAKANLCRMQGKKAARKTYSARTKPLLPAFLAA